ncbi:MAG: hypothetical protein ACXAEN_14285 [Candidatus Thorarchaeota archaeon]
MSGAFVPTRAALSRVWLISGGARADHTPEFQSCLKAMAASQAFGDIEKIECPDPEEFGEFIEIGVIQGAQDRETSSLVGRYPINAESDLLRLARKRCAFDFQVNFGECEDPKDFNDFQKKLIREDTYITNYGTDDLGALSSDENAVVNETADTSSKTLYEVLPLSMTKRGDDVIDNPGIDVVICDRPSCAGCSDESDGCEIIFVLAQNGAGSPGTAADIVYSIDKGQNWAEDDINSLLSSEAASALACVGDYVVVVSNASASLHYKLKADIIAGTAGGWIEVTTGFVAGGEPNDIWSVGNFAFVVGDGGYVYSLEDPPAGVTVLSPGDITTEDLQAVKAISEFVAMAVGDNDAVIYTTTKTAWTTPTNVPVTGGGLISCEMKSETEWWAGSDNGQLEYTVDAGESAWIQETLPGTGYTAIWDIHFATKSVGYLGVARTISGTARGQILRTYSGGGGNGTAGGWKILPEGAGNLPLNDLIQAVYACPHDPNFVVGTGTDDAGTDGVIIIGQD